MIRTDSLRVISGKLGPLVLVFGAYLIAYGHVSPGGGFQGGVVFASGAVLIAMGQGVDSFTSRVSVSTLLALEAVAFAVILVVGILGMVFGRGYLGIFLPVGGGAEGGAPFVIILNILIGLEVGAGVTSLCLALLEER